MALANEMQNYKEYKLHLGINEKNNGQGESGWYFDFPVVIRWCLEEEGKKRRKKRREFFFIRYLYWRRKWLDAKTFWRERERETNNFFFSFCRVSGFFGFWIFDAGQDIQSNNTLEKLNCNRKQESNQSQFIAWTTDLHPVRFSTIGGGIDGDSRPAA